MDRPILKWTSNSFELQTHMNLCLSIPKLNFKLFPKAIIESRPKTICRTNPSRNPEPTNFWFNFFIENIFFPEGGPNFVFSCSSLNSKLKTTTHGNFFCSFSKCGRGWIFLWQVLWNPRQLASRQKKILIFFNNRCGKCDEFIFEP